MPNGDIIRQYPESGNNPATSGGIAWRQILCLDAAAANTPGWWVPWYPFRNGSIQLSQAGGTPAGTVSLYTSNAAQMPANGYNITVGGTPHTGDVCTINVNGGGFIYSGSYAVVGGDTTTTIATKLVAALQAALNNAEQPQYPQFGAINASLITVSNGGANPTAVVTVLTTAPQLYFDLTSSVSGASATTTLTNASLDTTAAGALVAPTLTAPGSVQFMNVGTWIKANLTGYSGPGSITAVCQGVSP